MKAENPFQDVLHKMPPLMGNSARSYRRIPLDELDGIIGNSNNPYFTAFMRMDGEEWVYHFSENPIIVEQLPEKAGGHYDYYMSCRIQRIKNGLKLDQGITWWFNFFSLLRTDSQFSPLYPEWAKLGSAKLIIENLIALGEFTIGPDIGDNYFSARLLSGNRDKRFPILPSPIK